MNVRQTSDPELVELLNEYANGEIPADRFARLQEVLRGSAAARREYLAFFRVHAGLYDFIDGLSEHGEVGDGKSRGSGQKKMLGSRPRKTWRMLAFMAACALAVCIAILPFRSSWKASRPEAPNLARDEMAGLLHGETTRPIAMISRMADVVMAPGRKALQIGQGLQPTQLSLQSGLLQLDFLNGVSVILEGASDFELVSENRGALRQGRARIYAPSEEGGFILETNQATFIDRGTEFGVQVVPDGEAELHVFDGQVDVHRRSDDRLSHSVTSGRALAIMPNVQPQEIRVRPEEFPSLVRVSERVSERDSRRYQEWRQEREQLLTDRALVVYYDFEPDSESAQRVVNRAGHGLDGVVVGCDWATGRWPGKKALEFKRPHDRVRLNIPGEFNSLTLAVWMRLDGFDRMYNSIMLTDTFEDGHVHWQVRYDGKIDMGIKPLREKRLLYLSDRELGFDDLGRWMHLVAVIDRAQGMVLHYLDGREVRRLPIATGIPDDERTPVENPFLLRLGRAELGNWSPTEIVDPQTVRNLNGRIDEFSIYSRALDEAEVSRLFEIGRP